MRGCKRHLYVLDLSVHDARLQEWEISAGRAPAIMRAHVFSDTSVSRDTLIEPVRTRGLSGLSRDSAWGAGTQITKRAKSSKKVF